VLLARFEGLVEVVDVALGVAADEAIEEEHAGRRRRAQRRACMRAVGTPGECRLTRLPMAWGIEQVADGDARGGAAGMGLGL
jgi:hypothetical protein